jgi:hypothetical protein
LHQDWQEPRDLSVVLELRAYLSSTAVADLKDEEVNRFLRRIPPLARLRHPLIQAFDDQFSSADDRSALRKTISSVSDRQWIKQTFSSRWRGAAAIVAEGDKETAWLGAAGYHRERSPEDFYAWFASQCGSSSDAFMPNVEDRHIERVDRKVAQLDSWKLQLRLSTLVLLANALETGAAGPTRVLKPDQSGKLLLELSIAIDVIEEGDESLKEATIVLSPVAWRNEATHRVATRIVMAAVEAQAEKWHTAPLGGMTMSHSVILSEEVERNAKAARDSGLQTHADLADEIRLGTVAHYARATRLTGASVDGDPVQAICGYWFVPMHDHEELEICDICASVHEKMPE